MARKTRKHTSRKKEVHTIPELRRSFEHIEEFVDDMIHEKQSKDTIMTRLRKEWLSVFHKTLDKKSADSFVTHRMESKRAPRRHRGGGGPITGAPIDHQIRAGIYLDQGARPGSDGGLTKTVGGGYGDFIKYVDSGFSVPEIARNMDPVSGQSVFPIPSSTLGTNLVKTGGRRRTRKTGGGLGAILTQAFQHPISAGDIPPNPLHDLQTHIQGSVPGSSPDQIQRPPTYQIGAVYPRAVNINTQ